MANDAEHIRLPADFSGPAQFILYTRYGDPRQGGWVHKWLTTWDVQATFPWFPSDKIIIHKHFWPMLETAFKELTDTGLYKEIKSVGHCYDIRNVNGSDAVLSVHSWGAALDLNIEDNPIGAVGTWSDAFIQTMQKHTIYCGQTWIGHTEPMHFAMVNGS